MKQGLVKILAATAGIIYAGLGHSASVYVETPGDTIIDPLFAESISAGAYDVSADLIAGEFKNMSSATNDRFVVRSGIYEKVEIRNAGALPITLPFGALRMSVEGTFSGVGAGIYPRNANVNSSYSAQVGSFYSGTVVGLRVDRDGAELTLDEINNNGAIYSVTEASEGVLIAEVLMPAMEIEPDEILSIWYRLESWVAASEGTTTADFSNTATLSLVLPAGALFDVNTSVPLDWVTTVPVPPAVWLFGSALAGLMGLVRRRRVKGDS